MQSELVGSRSNEKLAGVMGFVAFGFVVMDGDRLGVERFAKCENVRFASWRSCRMLAVKVLNNGFANRLLRWNGRFFDTTLGLIVLCSRGAPCYWHILPHPVEHDETISRPKQLVTEEQTAGRKEGRNAHKHHQEEKENTTVIPSSGKPEIVEKMVEGRVRKFIAESSLVEQAFVKDPDQKVGQLIKAGGADINGFVRYEVGDGIEKEEVDFAAEVAAQVQQSS